MATTLTTGVPFTGVSVDEATWARMNVGHDGVLQGVGFGDPFRPFADSTGMTVKVTAGSGWTGGHFGEHASTVTESIAANATSHPRLDLVVLRADRPDNLIEIAVKTGTAAANPVPPDLQQDSTLWEVRLGIVRVLPGVVTITAADVFECRRLSLLTRSIQAPIGSILEYPSTTNPNALEFLPCDARQVHKWNYPELFNAYGFRFGGAGDNFSLPDRRGRVSIMADQGTNRWPGAGSVGSWGGSHFFEITPDNMPQHHHTAGSLMASANGSHTHNVAPHEHTVIPTSSAITNPNWVAVRYASAAAGFLGGAATGERGTWSTAKTNAVSLTTGTVAAHTHQVTGQTDPAGDSLNDDITHLPPFLTSSFYVVVR